MKKYRQTVFLDIDGVMADFEGEFCERFGYDHREFFSLKARYPLHAELIDEFVNSPSSYENLAPIFGGAVLLPSIIRQRGYYLVLLTSRNKKLAEVTREWLEGYQIQYNELWFSQHKGTAIEEFNRMYPGRRGYCLIDDDPVNFQMLPEGVAGLCWSQPWNENKHYPRIMYNEQVMRLEVLDDSVSKWREF